MHSHIKNTSPHKIRLWTRYCRLLHCYIRTIPWNQETWLYTSTKFVCLASLTVTTACTSSINFCFSSSSKFIYHLASRVFPARFWIRMNRICNTGIKIILFIWHTWSSSRIYINAYTLRLESSNTYFHISELHTHTQTPNSYHFLSTAKQTEPCTHTPPPTVKTVLRSDGSTHEHDRLFHSVLITETDHGFPDQALIRGTELHTHTHTALSAGTTAENNEYYDTHNIMNIEKQAHDREISWGI